MCPPPALLGIFLFGFPLNILALEKPEGSSHWFSFSGNIKNLSHIDASHPSIDVISLFGQGLGNWKFLTKNHQLFDTGPDLAPKTLKVLV